MNVRPIILKFEIEKDAIRALELDTLAKAKRLIDAAQYCLQACKQELHVHPPETVEEEIRFFKFTKQIPLRELIYHAEIRSFELQCPKAGREIQRSYTLKKIKKVNRFFVRNFSFSQYMDSGSDHLDLFYFSREHSSDIGTVESEFFFRDLEFGTSYDFLLGKVLAYTDLVDYLKKRLMALDHPEMDSLFSSSNTHPLTWTASPTDLVELIYALHHSGSIDNGHAELKNIANALSAVLHIDLGDIYRKGVDIKRRTKDRAKFLNNLSAGLESGVNQT